MQASAQPLVVQAIVATPTVQVEPAGSLFFKPTCIGAASQRTLTLHNTSRVPLVFQVCPSALTAMCNAPLKHKDPALSYALRVSRTQVAYALLWSPQQAAVSYLHQCSGC